MRIIAGAYRGLRLRTLKGAGLRPTSDHVRETLFNVLGESVREARFLDAYAGSGAVGIEALSRGASDVVFLEHHRPAAEIIRENLRALGVRERFQIIARPVWPALERLEREGSQFEIVFLDPPYDEVGEYHRSLRILARSRLLAPGSLVVAEHARQCRLEESYGELSLARLIRHGDSQLAFYRKAAGG
ncbi:MAG: 16S rRNA (guanine(966)-N(2))-methyltransferase RsmD [Terriglobia bacterium]